MDRWNARRRSLTTYGPPLAVAGDVEDAAAFYGRNRLVKPNLNQFRITRFRAIDLLNLQPVS